MSAFLEPRCQRSQRTKISALLIPNLSCCTALQRKERAAGALHATRYRPVYLKKEQHSQLFTECSRGAGVVVVVGGGLKLQRHMWRWGPEPTQTRLLALVK